MPQPGLEREAVGAQVLERSVGRFREVGIVPPTLCQLLPIRDRLIERFNARGGLAGRAGFT